MKFPFFDILSQMERVIHTLRMSVLSLAIGALGGSEVLAADEINAVRQALSSYRGQGELPLSAAADMMIMMLRQMDADGNGLDEGDLDFAVKRAGAQLRAGYASDRLRYDLDGDASVSRAEIEAVVARESSASGSSAPSQWQKERVDEIMLDDADGNGIISGVELVSVPASRKRDRSDDRLLPLAQAFLAADPDHDGIVTQAESFAIIAKVLSQPGQEPAINVQKGVLEQPAIAVGSCPPLQFDKDSAVVLVGAYEGKAISNVSVVGQDDATSVATIQIEPGTTPITLVLTSYDAMIWDIIGETSRVSKVVATSAKSNSQTGNPGVGVVGIESGKVEFIVPRECLKYFYDSRSPEALTTKAQVERLAGREVAAMIGQYGIDVTSVPSGEDTSPPDPSPASTPESTPPAFVSGTTGVTAQQLPLSKLADGTGDTFRELQRFSPSGVKEFRVENVACASKPEYYEVLPQQAGLMQLLQSGALTILSNTQGGSGLNYRIQSPMRFPSGLFGSLSVKFFLPKDVPMPKGNPGHSCVFVEQDASYSGATCN